MLSPLNKPNKHYGFIATGDVTFSKPVLYNIAPTEQGQAKNL